MSKRRSDISWTGEFSDPALEQALAATTAPKARASAKLCIVATTATSLGFFPLDLQMLPPDQASFFLGDRLLIALCCIAALVVLTRLTSQRQIVILTHIHQYTFFTLNALIFNHPSLIRHGGVLLPLIAMSLMTFLPGSFRAAAGLSAFAPSISFLFWGLLRPQPETPQDLVLIGLIILVAYVVGGLARSQFNRVRREEFLHIEGERQARQHLLEAKEAAEAGAKAKADFLAVMSHEIRTPMNGVLGMVRLTLDSPLSPEDRERLETANQSAQSLLTILDDILDISKLEAGQIAFDHAPFHLRQTIESVTRLLEPRAKEKGLSLNVMLAPSLPDWVSGDAARLRQILFNLIGNGVKFTERGSVTLSVEPKGEGLQFAVTDTGIGIAPQQRDHLFQAFGQADASISRRFGGTGLGLVVCKRLIEGLGGSIALDSRPGQGSCFRFDIPISRATEPQDMADTMESSAELPPLSILLAEDNLINQKVAQGFLQRAGHNVTLAQDGAQAVAMAQNGAFDLILMDMRMPEIDGLEATRRIRALPGPAGLVPIIALTANAMAEDRDRCRAAGMDGYLTKPIEQASLLSTIGQLLSKHPVPSGQDCLVIGDQSGRIGKILTGLGHRVFPVATAQVAQTILRARKFDVVVGLTDDPAIAQEQRAAGAIEVLSPAVSTEQLSACLKRHSEEPTLETVFSPQQLAQLNRLLLDNLKQQAALLIDPALTMEDLATIAHRVKGSAANMRLTALSEQADRALRQTEQLINLIQQSKVTRVELREAMEKVILQLQSRLAEDHLPTLSS